VKVGYEDINHTLILGEVAFREDGSTPEVSYGTHFFNDLVEANILPLAIYPDQPETVFKESFLLDSPNLLSSLLPEFANYKEIVRLIHVPTCADGRYLQVYQDGQGQQGIGYLGYSEQ